MKNIQIRSYIIWGSIIFLFYLTYLIYSSLGLYYSKISTSQARFRPKVYLIGDSITQQSFSVPFSGFGAGLADWYTRFADIYNRGYSGYNSRWVKQILPEILPLTIDESIILSTIFLGANDANSNLDQHVPISEYQSNIRSIIHHLLTVNPKMKIILITPPSVNHLKWKTRHNSQVSKYADAIRELGSEFQFQPRNLMRSGELVSNSMDWPSVVVLDLWKDPYLISPECFQRFHEDEGVERVEGSLEACEGLYSPTNPTPRTNPSSPSSALLWSDLRDGLHLSSSGNEKVLRGLKQVIHSHFPKLSPDQYYHNLKDNSRELRLNKQSIQEDKSSSSSSPSSSSSLSLDFPIWREMMK